MRTGKAVKLHMLILTICLLLMALPAHAAVEEPLTMTVETDPDCLLSEAGDMTFFRFKIKNNLEEEYVLDNMTIQGDILAVPKLVAEQITIKANDVLEFTVENVRIEEFMFDMDLSFQLTWSTTVYVQDDGGQFQPVAEPHMISAPIRIERFVEPVMTLSVAPDVLLAREGDLITVTYTLTNDTKFDMTNITLQDSGIPQPTVSLEKNVLNAGEQMQATAVFSMGDSTLELYPTAQYTVRGVESKATASETVTVELVDIDFRMEVEKYPATAEGTLFRITLINDGSHPITDIRIIDEIGTQIAKGITLAAGRERTISCTIPSAVSASTVRYISFEATGVDSVGGTVTARSPSAYEVLPFVESDQVQLNLSVSLTGSDQTDDGSSRLKLMFEVRNDSQVPISNAVITEADYFKGVVNEYASLATGTTSFEKEFIVPAGTRSLTFVLTALDPAQTQYATVPLTLDLTPLAAPKPTNPPAIRPGKTVDTTGTIYDTERYAKMFRMASLIVLALTLVFLLLSLIFRVAENNVRSLLPREAHVRRFGPRRSRTGLAQSKENPNPAHDMFGYMQPAKLRYMDRADKLPSPGQDQGAAKRTTSVQAPNGAAAAFIPLVSRNTNASRREGDITAVPIHKDRRRPVMMSQENTMPFAPVHEAPEHKEAGPETAVSRGPVPETPPQREPVRKAPVKQEAVSPTSVTEPPAHKEHVPQEPIKAASVPEEKKAVPVGPETKQEDTSRKAAEDSISVAPRVLEVKPTPRIVPRQKLEIVRVSAEP